jgi:hypothetical protein
VRAQAHVAGKSVTVAVEKRNRGQTLYRRLGFREIADHGEYWDMEWGAATDRRVSGTDLRPTLTVAIRHYSFRQSERWLGHPATTGQVANAVAIGVRGELPGRLEIVTFDRYC